MIKSDAHHGINRRQMLQSVAGIGAGALASGYPLALRAAAAPPALVTSIRSLSNRYHAVWKIGADAFGKAVGIPNTTLVTEANSEKGISDIRAMIAKTGGNMVLNVDPNNTPDARPIVEACFKAKVYVVSWWNKPADLHPWDFDPYYISHIEFDGVTNGGYITEELFKAMGDEGGFVAVGGMISELGGHRSPQRLDGDFEEAPQGPASRFPDWRLAVAKGLRHHSVLAHPFWRQDQGRVGR